MDAITVSVEELSAKAQQAYNNEDYPAAADLFQQAANQLTASDPTRAAEMRNNASVALLQAGKPQAALEAAIGTDLVFAAANDRKREAMAFGNQAAAMEELKQRQQAYDTYLRASTIFKEIGENELRSMVLKRMSSLQVQMGKRMDAIATMQAALLCKEKLTLRERFLKWLFNVLFRLLRSGGAPMPM